MPIGPEAHFREPAYGSLRQEPVLKATSRQRDPGFAQEPGNLDYHFNQRIVKACCDYAARCSLSKVPNDRGYHGFPIDNEHCLWGGLRVPPGNGKRIDLVYSISCRELQFHGRLSLEVNKMPEAHD